MLEMCVWAGSNLSSFPQAAAAVRTLAGVEISAKRIHRMTAQTGEARCGERNAAIDDFRERTLVERTSPHPAADIPEVGVVMMDGGRHQRRDHFGQPSTNRSTHWKEDKVGLTLSMASRVSETDPCPDFPAWLVTADVVREIARLGGTIDESQPDANRKVQATGKTQQPATFGEADAKRGADKRKQPADTSAGSIPERTGSDDAFPGGPDVTETLWPNAPKLQRREMIASTSGSDEFGWHLEHAAWQHGVTSAERQAFVADGATVNWSIHRRHFSQMTGILDLMHALSYAHRAATELGIRGLYRRYAEGIWQGRVAEVIADLKHQASSHPPPDPESDQPDPRQHTRRALTYYENSQQRMDYPSYRRNGLPLTSSHIESAIKQINLRIKGTEKFWNHPTAESILQLRADSLSDSDPLTGFWLRTQANQTGANRYRTAVV